MAEPLITELKVPALPDFVGIVRFLLSGLLARSIFSSEEIEDVKVAVSEACTNVVQYAYKNKKKGLINIKIAQTNKTVEIVVSDSGVGFNPENPPTRKIHDNDIHMGLGLVFMKNLMDSVKISSRKNKGTIVTMVKKSKG